MTAFALPIRGRGVIAAAALAGLPATALRGQDPVPAASTITVQAGATVDHDTVTVGDVVRLVVRVRAPLGSTVNFPTAVDSLGPVQALEPPTVRDGADSSAVDRVATYRLAAWDVGDQPIRLGDVLVQSDDGERRVALTLPRLFVKSVLPADSALRVPKPARALLDVRPPIPWWWWLIAALAAIALGLGIWWWRRRNRAETGTGDPFADAEAAFARIERLRLPEAGEPGRHAALMADVVRRYLAQRHAVASLANTSGELLAAVRGIEVVPFDRLQRLLHEIDPVKFAAAPIPGVRARELGDDARTIVREEHAAAEAAVEKEVAA
jgi:hypothetical protein